MSSSETFVEKMVELALNNVAAFLLGVSVVLYVIYVQHRIDDKFKELLTMVRSIHEFIEQTKQSRTRQK